MGGKWQKYSNYFFNLLLIILVIFVALTKGPTIYNNFNLEQQKPEFVSLTQLTGETMTFPVLGEKKLVVFWMIHCPPCKYEMEKINQLISVGILRPEDVIAINFVDDKEQIVDFIKRQFYQFFVVLDNDGRMADKYKVNSTPTLFLFDGEGVIQWATSGLTPFLEYRIKRFFGKT